MFRGPKMTFLTRVNINIHLPGTPPGLGTEPGTADTPGILDAGVPPISPAAGTDGPAGLPAGGITGIVGEPRKNKVIDMLKCAIKKRRSDQFNQCFTEPWGYMRSNLYTCIRASMLQHKTGIEM